ncbi:hypothetical protein WA588_003940, partial [Blastocystis sp. NMH]
MKNVAFLFLLVIYSYFHMKTVSSISTWNGLVTNSLHGHSIITTTVSPTAKRPTISLRPAPSMNPPESQRPISSIEPDSTLNPVRPTPFSDSVESDNKSSTMSRSMHPLDSEQLERILHLLTDGNATTPNRIIYFSPNGWGGFCNSFRAIRSLALYSLLYGFKLRIQWDNYFEVMSEDLKVLSAPVDWNCHYIMSFDIPFNENGIGVNRCIRTNDYMDVTWRMMEIPANVEKLVTMGLFDSIPSNEEVSHLFSLVLFRLNDSLRNQTDVLFSEYPHPLLGLQIRTGGRISNTPEESLFYSLDKVDPVLAFVHSFVLNNTLANVTLFLSTDSNAMVQAIKEKSPFPVVTLNAYSIGHSSPLRNPNSLSSSLKRAVMDIYVLSKCDSLITTRSSSFGDTAAFLSSSPIKQIIG